MKTLLRASAVLLTLLGISGQSFEVASIKPCKPGTPEPTWEHAGMANFVAPGGRFNAEATTIKFLLEWAYEIQPVQHSGGPAWLESDRYDIVAKAEGPASESQVKLMVQKLLADRFKLSFHKESKELTVLALTAGKGNVKLETAKEGEQTGMRGVQRQGPDGKVLGFRVTLTRFSLSQLANTFSRQMGRVILDRTGLAGEYDFTVDLVVDDSHPSPMDPSVLITALQEQIGLKVESLKTPVDILVIDHAARVLADN